METARSRFLRYVTYYTTSDEHTGASPSTERQKDLGRVLLAELESLGLAGARRTLDDTELGGEGIFHSGFLALVQAKGVDYDLWRGALCRWFLQIQIAGEHGSVEDVLAALILHL